MARLGGQFHHITPAIGRLLVTARLAIAKSLGLTVRTIHEHFHLSYDMPIGPLAEMMKPLAQPSTDVNGPITLDARYVTEDVPVGLVPIV